MDRVAAFLVALVASATVVGAVAWSLRDVRAISFESPPAPAPREERGVALLPLQWIGEAEEARSPAPEPSPAEPPRASFRPWTRRERPAVAGFARSRAGVFRARAGGRPPPDEMVGPPPPETRRAAAIMLREITPAERPEAPELRVAPPPREPVPAPPTLEAGRLRLSPPLAEELFR